MAALYGAVAHAGGPGHPVVVGDDLDLDMTNAALDQLFHEDGGIAEGFERLGAGAFECGRKLIRRIYPANAMTAAARRRLDQQRIAQALGVTQGIGDGFHRASAPGSNRNLGLLRQTLGGYFVAQQPHHGSIRSDVHDAHFVT